MVTGMAWLSCALPPRSAVQVELIEDEVAQVVDLDSGVERAVPRAALPRGVHEGDVIVDGALDPALTAELRRQVEDLHARLAVPIPRGLDLSEGDAAPLTSDPE